MRLAFARLAVPSTRLAVPAARTLCSANMSRETLEKLGVTGLDDDALRRVFDNLATPSAGGIPTKTLASTISKAYGYGSGDTTASAGGLAYGKDPVSSIFELVMLWTVQSMDSNSDKVISWDEFRASVRQSEANFTQAQFFSEDALKVLGIDSFDDDALKKAFDEADANQNGELDCSEVSVLFQKVLPQASDSPEFREMVERVMLKVDSNGDKAISWSEFKSAFALYQLKQRWHSVVAGWHWQAR